MSHAKLDMWLSRVRGWPKPIRLAAGVGLIVLGFLGLFLPVLQGLLFLAAGGALLATDVPLVRRWLDHAVAKWNRGRRASSDRVWIRLDKPSPPHRATARAAQTLREEPR